MAAVVWILVAIVLAGIEIFTLSFVAVYPALGALAATVTALAGGSFGIQLLVVAVVSVGALVLTRKPLLRLMKRMPNVPSNAPSMIGKRAVVVIAIDEGTGQRGQVRVGTEHWSARSEGEEAIAEGTTVEVVRIDGVALVVRPVGGAAAAQAT
jgi:membrane protein implicated in regulation of membrane protease activity